MTLYQQYVLCGYEDEEEKKNDFPDFDPDDPDALAAYMKSIGF